VNLDSNINSDLNLNSTSERLVSVLVRIPVGIFIWQYWSLELWACDQNLIKVIKIWSKESKSDQEDQNGHKHPLGRGCYHLRPYQPDEKYDKPKCDMWQIGMQIRWHMTPGYMSPGDMWHIWHRECKMWHQATCDTNVWHKVWHMWHTAALPGGMWWWLGWASELPVNWCH